MGRLSDRIGRRKVLIPAVLLFSLLAGVSGLAGGVGFGLIVALALKETASGRQRVLLEKA